MTDRAGRRSALALLAGVGLGVCASALVATALVATGWAAPERPSNTEGTRGPAVAASSTTLLPPRIAPLDADGEQDNPDEADPITGASGGVEAGPPVSLPGEGKIDQSGELARGSSPATAVPGGSPVPAGSAGANPAGQVSCPTATSSVRSASELQQALDTAQAGDSIKIQPGVYAGTFVVGRSGTASAPIFLCGAGDSVLDGGGIKEGYVLHLRSVQYWRLVGFTVRNGQKGVVADATTNSIIQGLTVEGIGDEGLHLRSASSYNTLSANTVRRTGLRRDKFGEGIYVGSATSNWGTYSQGLPDRSDYNLVEKNVISETGSEAIDVKEGTTGGRIVANVLDGTGILSADSLIDVKGNGWIIEGNLVSHGPGEGIQTHQILDGWGRDNIFRTNVVEVDGDGNHFYIHQPGTTNNRVMCDNRTSSGKAMRSNVTCVA